MPKETSIAVSKKTLRLLKEYQKEFAFKSLEEAIENAVRWARLWNYVDAKQRRELAQRVSDLEFRLEKLDRQTLQNAGSIGKILKRVRALEKAKSDKD